MRGCDGRKYTDGRTENREERTEKREQRRENRDKELGPGG